MNTPTKDEWDELLDALEEQAGKCFVCRGFGTVPTVPGASPIHEDCPACSDVRALIQKHRPGTSHE